LKIKTTTTERRELGGRSERDGYALKRSLTDQRGDGWSGGGGFNVTPTPKKGRGDSTWWRTGQVDQIGKLKEWVLRRKTHKRGGGGSRGADRKGEKKVKKPKDEEHSASRWEGAEPMRGKSRYDGVTVGAAGGEVNHLFNDFRGEIRQSRYREKCSNPLTANEGQRDKEG